MLPYYSPPFSYLFGREGEGGGRKPAVVNGFGMLIRRAGRAKPLLTA